MQSAQHRSARRAYRRDGAARQPAGVIVGASVDLHGADLHGSRTVGADLHDANLTGANLRDARLVGVNAAGTDLTASDLRGANLVAARLRGARLTRATLGDAILCARSGDTGTASKTVCADLQDADLHGVDLRAVQWCPSRNDDALRACRTVTREELVQYAHADLRGAQAPA